MDEQEGLLALSQGQHAKEQRLHSYQVRTRFKILSSDTYTSHHWGFNSSCCNLQKVALLVRLLFMRLQVCCMVLSLNAQVSGLSVHKQKSLYVLPSYCAVGIAFICLTCCARLGMPLPPPPPNFIVVECCSFQACMHYWYKQSRHMHTLFVPVSQ